MQGKPAFRTEIRFDNNRLLADLLGEFDAHLSMLEDKLGVEAVAHGNVIVVKGTETGCVLAKDVLQDLYERLKAGHTVVLGDIDGAIRHAHAGARDDRKKGEGSDGAGQLRTRKKLVTARTPLQSRYIEALQAEQLIFATGPAGTGKTYLAVAHAAGRLERGETERLILSRPAVEAGERLGFLPGDLREKVDPYLRPLYDALYDVLPAEKVERDLESGVIEIAPLAFMRGRTLSHATIILDEAQNCTSMQMKMFLTRLGEGSKMVVTGDPSQIDLPPGQTSGLGEAIGILKDVKGIAHIPFTSADVVRHELVARIVEAYEKAR
ncbi:MULTISPECIES: PhoH family protein [Rhodomicrobium]|uniref:PhoH family protein n=1 Tax=Rhodomicrobium TaxID=1068 RepID=UPI001FDA3DD4|nr:MULTISPECIES: PhoH family protein [Rhodomicrobium]